MSLFFVCAFSFLLLLLINQSLIYFKVLFHRSSISIHKKFAEDNIPLSGGIFFFIITCYLSIKYNQIHHQFIYFLIPFLILGIIVDINDRVGPKLRLLLQFIITFFLVTVGNLIVFKTNLPLLDLWLDNYFFSIFFSCFCIMVLINGINFLDGVNNNVSGLFFLIIISIILILHKTGKPTNDLNQYLILLFSIFLFHIFNFYEKNFLGESGSYVVSVLISNLVINFINDSDLISPLLAISLLWYPAIETLFSIIRKIWMNKNPFAPDTLHLHTLILKYLKFYNVKKNNSLSGFLINFFLLPNFLIAINFYNNSKILVFISIFYIFLYVIFYIKIYSFLKKKKIIV